MKFEKEQHKLGTLIGRWPRCYVQFASLNALVTAAAIAGLVALFSFERTLALRDPDI